ncbi:MAG: glucose-6-phosphate dehydrogenase [Candidatus Paceibacterota bacterium]
MKLEPTTLVLFGITGDLSQKKILPALYDMYKKSILPKDFSIVGFSRREFTNEEIKNFVVKDLKGTLNPEFLEKFSYVQGDFDDPSSYIKLGKHLSDIDKAHGGCTNKLFYLSTPPNFYERIALNISDVGLSIPCGGEDGFTRILLEKPFGKDLDTAKELDVLLEKLFKEEQIYRIDHYLAKESLHKIIDLYRRDETLSSKWTKEYIKEVNIKVYEKSKVGNRGNFYDGVGALRDVGQNHILQMLALVAMDIPKDNNPKNIQKSRADILRKLKPLDFKKDKIEEGQYEGYLSEPGVSKDSKTETFFRLTAYLNDPRFECVPFVLSSGKALCANVTEIVVVFKDGLRVVFSVPREDSLPAYERILLDCIAGDQTVFISTGEVLAEWGFISPIEENLKNITPFIYKEGMNPEGN